VNLLRGNIDTVKQNTLENVIDASKEVGLEVNTEKVAVPSSECRAKARHKCS
jgi:hypothetical protein